MTISRLDKWIKEEPEPSKYIHIFINGVELTTEFEGRGKTVNYENLMLLLKKIYGVYIMLNLYIGVYDDVCIDSKTRKEQEAYLNYLTGLGYHIRKCVKYHKANGEIIEKGAEVSMTVDLEEYGHPTCDKYDTAVVFCNKIDKYRGSLNKGLKLDQDFLDLETIYREILEITKKNEYFRYNSPYTNNSYFIKEKEKYNVKDAVNMCTPIITSRIEGKMN